MIFCSSRLNAKPGRKLLHNALPIASPRIPLDTGKEIAMILVRMVFQAKFSTAGKAVEEMKQMMERSRGMAKPGMRARILTDLSGPFDTVVHEMEFESLAEWEKFRTEMFSNPDSPQMQSSGPPPFEGGRAEFYTIEASY